MSKISFLSSATIGVYCVLGITFWMFFQPEGLGDEGLMSLYLDEGKKMGFYSFFSSANFSVPHGLLAYPLSLVLPNFIALRLISLIGSIFIWVYLSRKSLMRNSFAGPHLAFYIASGSFLIGTNDTLLFCFLVVFLFESYLVMEGYQKELPAYAYFSLVSAFFTREFSIIYLPLVATALLLIFRDKYQFYPGMKILMGSILFWLVLNLPPLIHQGKIGYDNKNIENKQLDCTWTQRQYLSQLKANADEIPEFSHVTWEETRAYLDQNGENSLPRTFSESIFFDMKMTVKEFVKDFLFLIKAGIRNIGLAIFFPVLVFVINFKKPSLGNYFVGIGQFAMMSIFSLIIISYIEIRWLAPVFLIGIVALNLGIKQLKNKNWDLINRISLGLLSLYGILTYWRMIHTSPVWLTYFG